MARLQHPNIVQVYEVGETAGGAFVSLEFVDGQSLRAAYTAHHCRLGAPRRWSKFWPGPCTMPTRGESSTAT